MTDISINEQKNKRKGRNISIIIHLLLLLIAFLYFFPVVNEPDPPIYAVNVEFDFVESSLSDYAHEDVGKMRPKADPVKSIDPTPTPEVEVPKPDIDIPDPDPTPMEETTPPITTDAVQDESPVQAVEDDIPVDDPEPDPVPVPQKPKPVEKPTTKPVEKPTSKPTSKPTGSPTGSTTGKDATGDPSASKNSDSGTGKGTSGTGKGSSSGNDGDSGVGNGGPGTGEYDGSGDGIFGRRVIYQNTAELLAIGFAKQKSKIVANLCINRSGIVTDAELLPETQANLDRATLKKVIRALKGYKYEPDLSAPKEQCGKFTVILDINALMGK